MTKEENEQADSSSASATDEATYEPSLADEEAASAAALEEKAIAQAMQSADSSYVPSPSLLASEDPEPLLTQVDGPLLSTYEASKPSVYQAKAVPVALRSKFDVPIHITAGGSVVEFEIFTDKYDIACEFKVAYGFSQTKQLSGTFVDFVLLFRRTSWRNC